MAGNGPRMLGTAQAWRAVLIDRESLGELLGLSDQALDLISVRHSSRARRLIFKSSVRGGFELVLPRRYDDDWVLEAVAKRKSMVRRRLSEIKADRSRLLPQWVTLPAVCESWSVSYEMSENASPSVRETARDTLRGFRFVHSGHYCPLFPLVASATLL